MAESELSTEGIRQVLHPFFVTPEERPLNTFPPLQRLSNEEWEKLTKDHPGGAFDLMQIGELVEKNETSEFFRHINTDNSPILLGKLIATIAVVESGTKLNPDIAVAAVRMAMQDELVNLGIDPGKALAHPNFSVWKLCKKVVEKNNIGELLSTSTDPNSDHTRDMQIASLIQHAFKNDGTPNANTIGQLPADIRRAIVELIRKLQTSDPQTQSGPLSRDQLRRTFDASK